MDGRQIKTENLSLNTSLRLSDNVPVIAYAVNSNYTQAIRLDIVHPLPTSISTDQIVLHPEHMNWDVRPVNQLPPAIECNTGHRQAIYFSKNVPSNGSFTTYYAVDTKTKQNIRDLLKIRPAIRVATRDIAEDSKQERTKRKSTDESGSTQTQLSKGENTANPVEKLVEYVDGYTFEHFIADLWERQGWNAQVTNGSGDEGVDVVAIRNEPYELVSNIQVKHYTDTVISRPDIQQYSGLQQLMDVDTVAVVTSSSFSSPAEDWAAKTNVKLIDGDDLKRIIEKYDAYDLVRDYISE